LPFLAFSFLAFGPNYQRKQNPPEEEDKAKPSLLPTQDPARSSKNHRTDAEEFANQRNDFFRRATEAYKKGDRGVAAYFAEEVLIFAGRKVYKKKKEENSRL